MKLSKIEIVSRIRRSKSSRGAALATTPMALEQYRLHFQSQFINTFHVDPVSGLLSPIARAVDLDLQRIPNRALHNQFSRW